MNTELAGIISEEDTREIREWVEKQIGSAAERKSEITEIQCGLVRICQALDAMQKKIRHIERILE